MAIETGTLPYIGGGKYCLLESTSYLEYIKVTRDTPQ